MQLILKEEIKMLLNLIRILEKNIKSLEKQTEPMVKELNSSLSSIDGVGKITLPVLLGEIGDIKNYNSSAQLASRAGISPLENSSAKNNYKRVNSGGNRRLNTAIHRVALYQIRKNELASNYYLKKQAEGKTKKEALRCLKRRLVDIIFSVMKNNKVYQIPERFKQAA
jgi:transposase